MSHGKFLLVLVFLLISAGPLRAQWESSPWPDAGSDRMGMCRDIVVRVRDFMGAPIIGAVVTTEDNGIPFTTDSQGLASIPCQRSDGILPRMEVRAPGYNVSRVTMLPGGRSRLEVTLDKRDPVGKAAENTINVRELYATVQAESQDLQNQAAGALQRKDYDKAEKLLLQAEELTPSLAGIATNLGIVALRRKDLNMACSWFEKAAKISPHQADIVSNLGLVRWMQHRTEESYRLVKQAASMGYETGLGNYILGTVALGQGQNKEATQRLKKISPDRFPYRDLYLSIALRNLGKTRAADETYRKFQQRNPVPYAMVEENGVGP
jgi:Flp pilus assembly protein TadD